MTVLPPCNLRHPPPNPRPPIPDQPRPLQTIHTSATNLLPPQIFFFVAPRLVPECTRNTQFLAFVHYRSAVRAIEFYPDSSDNDENIPGNSGLLVDAARAAKYFVAACDTSGGMRVHGHLRRGCFVASCLWMGCMGCLDSCSGLVCLVAGLDDGCCVCWEFVLHLASSSKGVVMLYIAYGEV